MYIWLTYKIFPHFFLLYSKFLYFEVIENLFKMEPWLEILIPLAIIFICGFCACCALWDHRREIERERREEAEKQANNLELGPINSGTIAFF